MHLFGGLETVVKEEAPLAPLTSYRLGGPAEFFAEPRDEAALANVLARATAAGLPVRGLGHGTNLLVAEAGVRGLVVRLPQEGFSRCEADEMVLRVSAGHSLPALVAWSLAHELTGLEFLAGVPGTVGAALRMNAGGKYGQIGARALTVTGCTVEGRPFRKSAAECGFGYRDSGLREVLVTSAELAVRRAGAGEARQRFLEILAEKRATQPPDARSAGCVFKNPPPGIAPPAGKLIEELGFKGQRVGGARVSPRHANFVVCAGAARAADVIELIRRIRARAWAERGVRLELEIAVWGVAPEELWPPEMRAAAQVA